MNAKILGVGPRTANFLKSHYLRPRAKQIARDFSVSVATAERWLAGEAPTVAHIEEMTAIFGERYLRTVFQEAFEQNDKRFRELEKALSRVLPAQRVAGPAVGMVVTPVQGTGIGRRIYSAIGALIGTPSPATGAILPLPPDPIRSTLVQELIATIPPQG